MVVVVVVAVSVPVALVLAQVFESTVDVHRLALAPHVLAAEAVKVGKPERRGLLAETLAGERECAWAE